MSRPRLAGTSFCCNWQRLLVTSWWCLVFHATQQPAAAEVDRNNWVVLVDTSRYWYNYRHAANVLSFYHTVKRLGVPDSHIIVMLSEDAACSPRNALPGTIYNHYTHPFNLYGENVEVDYRGDEVSVDNFIRLLTGRHPPNTPRNKRLLTDPSSNIFIFITGHSGEEFIKFQDWEELTSNDIADAFGQMHKQRRFNKIFWLSDTCQAASLQNQFYTPGVVAMGSSDTKENSYSHHVDHQLGVAVVDRFSYHAFNHLRSLSHSSTETMKTFHSRFRFDLLHSHPQVRSDLFTEKFEGQKPSTILLTEFLASTAPMHFWNASLQLVEDSNSIDESGTCAFPTSAGADGHNGTCQALRHAVPTIGGGKAVKKSLGTLHTSVAPLISLFPGLHKLFAGEHTAASLESGRISTLSLRWNMGFAGCDPTVAAWLLGFIATMSLLGCVL